MTKETYGRAARGAVALAALPLALALTTSDADAQRAARRQQPIEIRGQVPTPQVVTVRPREVPAYERQLLVPDFYDHDFWQAILPGYQLVSQRLLTGNARLDSLARIDSARMSDSTRRVVSDSVAARAAIGSGLFQRRLVADSANPLRPLSPPATPPGGTRLVPPGAPTTPVRPDTTRTPPSTGGTPPATTQR